MTDGVSHLMMPTRDVEERENESRITKDLTVIKSEFRGRRLRIKLLKICV